MNKICPVFICGHRKSGTTLFRNLLDGHPELLVYPVDINLLYAYFPDYIINNNSEDKLIERLKKILFIDLNEQLSSEDKDSLLNVLDLEKYFFKDFDYSKLKDLNYIINKLIFSYSNIIKKKYSKNIKLTPVLKETSIEIYANEILSWFPNAKFLHIVREPKDNFAALKAGVKNYYSKLGENEKETLASTINRARLGMEYGLLNILRFGNDKYKIIRFEDLVNDPYNTLTSICIFLNISFNEKLFTPLRLDRPTQGNSFDKSTKFKSISNKHVDKWKDRISEKEAQIIEFYFKDVMEKYGYSINYPIDELADSTSDFYKWYNYRYFFRDRFKE